MPIQVRCFGEDGWTDVEVSADPLDTAVNELKNLLTEELGRPTVHLLLSAGPRHLDDGGQSVAEAVAGCQGGGVLALTCYSDLADGSLARECLKHVGAPAKKLGMEKWDGFVRMQANRWEPQHGYVDSIGFFPAFQPRSARGGFSHRDLFDTGGAFDDPPQPQTEIRTSVCRIPETARRGISLEQLRTLLAFIRRRCRDDGTVEAWVDKFPGSPTYCQPLRYDAINLYQATDWVIKPATKAHSCSYVELVAEKAEAQMPKWFVSHAWAESVLRFVICVERHFELRRLEDKDCVWVCAYANNQHELGADLVRDPKQTSFFRAMRLCVGVLLVLDEHATPFQRIWCCFEEAVALSDHERETAMLLDIATVCEGRGVQLCDGPSELDLIMAKSSGSNPPGHEWTVKAEREENFEFNLVVKSLPAIDMQAAQASQELDKWRILNSIAGRPESELDLPPLADHQAYDGIARRLRAHFAVNTWRKSCGADVPAEAKEVISEALRGESAREHLHLNFVGSHRNFSNAELVRLASAMPRELVSLRLELRWCEVGRVGAAALGESLPSTLKQLQLSFEESVLGIGSVLGLMQQKPKPAWTEKGHAAPGAGDTAPSQEELAKHMYSGALAALARGLPSWLERLTMSFEHCDGVEDEDLRALGRSLPASLRELDLTFKSCKGFSASGVVGLAKGLPKALESLRLDMRATMTVGPAGAVALAKNLPEGLESLFMSFYPGAWPPEFDGHTGVRKSGQADIREWRRTSLQAVRRGCCSVL